jgi:UDP-N-acetylmuramate dehydrogenase
VTSEKLNILKNSSLKPYNSFGLDVNAKEFISINSLEQMRELIPLLKDRKYIILGGGSNVVFVHDFDGLVILNNIQGKQIHLLDETTAIVSACSGENWHAFVLWTLDQGYYGLENLSLIPGSVGAGPIQNIGAYGVELKDSCVSVEAIDLVSGELHTFSNKDCKFGYRESVFKHDLKGIYFIYKVNFELSANSPLHTKYGTIQEELLKNGISNPNHRDISNAVIAIRSSKLPSPSVLGNAGSFFKNPIVSIELTERLKNQYPEIPSFTDKEGYKIPAGWLIERAGFKGKIAGNVGSHKDQALVIVNYGGATGQEIYDYSESIIHAIYSKFEILLEREVNIIN